MSALSSFLPQPPDACWRAFIDASVLTGWVPGLRRARVVALDELGRALEILFEYSASLTYSLTYAYDAAAREVRWEPRAGKRDAVRGFARFDVEGTGTRFTYSLEPGLARTEPALSVGDPAAMVAAFTRWMAGGA